VTYGTNAGYITTYYHLLSESSSAAATPTIVTPGSTVSGYKSDGLCFSCANNGVLVWPTAAGNNPSTCISCGLSVSNNVLTSNPLLTYPVPGQNEYWPSTTTTPITGDSCTTYPGLCVSLPYGCKAPGGSGDPQFTGFQGQSYQFHGIPNEYFNVITTPNIQLNAHFKYISSGHCTYNNTECWSHPGTYISKFGIMIGSNKIKLVAGTYGKGIYIEYNNEVLKTDKMRISKNDSTIYYPSNDVFEISTDSFLIKIINADEFFNFQVALKDSYVLDAGKKKLNIQGDSCADHHTVHDKLLKNYPDLPIHGLIGQTWRNAVYCGKLYEGQVDDYLSGGLFGVQFPFNRFEY
jgi:hypothetical protein